MFKLFCRERGDIEGKLKDVVREVGWEIIESYIYIDIEEKRRC